MVKTQIYLTERQQAELRRLAELWGRTQDVQVPYRTLSAIH
jgi:hypothetical protein